jgi:anthranilate phosphoribosyltransferase
VFAQALSILFDSKSLSTTQAYEVMKHLMDGELSPVQIAAYLAALRTKGETIPEILGSARAMREASIHIHANDPVVVDTCGTGGDSKGSFNLSTAAAFVVAGAGFTVAKHGNRSVSSQSGSADVLAALGISLDLKPNQIESLLQKEKIAFLFAPQLHPAMKHAMPVRKELGARTIFNLLGPLCNPANPTVQLLGVFHEKWVMPIAQVLVELGVTDGAVVHGEGYDEVILSGATHVAEIVNSNVTLTQWTPEDFGVTRRPDFIIPGGDAAKNATILLSVLKNEPSLYLDVVSMNAAVAIRAAIRAR